MLKYLSKGVRTERVWSTGTDPYSRGVWEFMAIIKGEAFRRTQASGRACYVSSRLFISKPSSKHTWHVRQGCSCEIVTMHFDTIPPQIQNLFGSFDHFSVPLSPDDTSRIQGVFTSVFPHYYKPDVESILRYRQALLELSTIVLAKENTYARAKGVDRNAERAQQAVRYFSDHLSRRVTIAEICKVMHLSPPHIRRIFKQSFKQSPKVVLENIALEEACRMAVETPFLLKEIASSCGFAGFPQFSRAFKRRFGSAPEAWRKRHRPG